MLCDIIFIVIIVGGMRSRSKGSKVFYCACGSVPIQVVMVPLGHQSSTIILHS